MRHCVRDCSQPVLTRELVHRHHPRQSHFTLVKRAEGIRAGDKQTPVRRHQRIGILN